jgi:BolA protein
MDESDQHAGHAGSRMLASPSGETHFRVGIVSAAFEGLNTVKRHRLVYQVWLPSFNEPMVHAAESHAGGE